MTDFNIEDHIEVSRFDEIVEKFDEQSLGVVTAFYIKTIPDMNEPCYLLVDRLILSEDAVSALSPVGALTNSPFYPDVLKSVLKQVHQIHQNQFRFDQYRYFVRVVNFSHAPADHRHMIEEAEPLNLQ